MIVSIEPTPTPGRWLVTFAGGRQIVLLSAPRSCGYFNEPSEE